MNPINFKEARDIGEIIQSSFVFVKQEFKTLFGLLLLYAGPFILIYAIANAYFVGEQQRMQTEILQGGFAPSPSDPFWALRNLPIKPYLTMLVSGFVSMVMVTIITFSYVKLYVEKGKENVKQSDVWELAKSEIVPYMGYSLAYAGVIILGSFLFFIPGVYAYVAFSLMFVVKVIEGGSLGTVFSRSQKLISGYWWQTFGLYLVMMIIVAVIAGTLGIFQGAMSVSQYVTGYNEDINILSMALAAVIAFVSYLFYIFLYLAQAFHYFSLIEKKESPSLTDRIDNIKNF